MSRVKVPAGMNLVRVTGLGIGYHPPKGFEREWVQLEGDHQRYLMRIGYRLERCPRGHSFNEGCILCAPYHGTIAISIIGDLAFRVVERRCLRSRTVVHRSDALFCDCLRTELPVEARAKSSGALGTPDRNHTCPACYGTGTLLCEGLGAVCCPRCAGTGERKANREPADHAFPAATRGREAL